MGAVGEENLITIVIPAYNEGKSISKVLTQIKASQYEGIQEIIVVDDGSTDQTARIAEDEGVKVIRHIRNRGYGASVKTGIHAAETEWVLIMDADGQHRVEDLPALLAFADNCDMVVGQRTGLFHSPLWRMPGKWLILLLANYIVRQRIPDLNSGFRLFKRDIVLRYLHLCPQGFSFSSTITITLMHRGYNVQFVPIQVNKRRGKSTVSLMTGLETITLLLRIATLFDPLRIFMPISSILVLIGLLWGIRYAWRGFGVSVGSMLAIVTGGLLFVLGLISDQISQMRLERYE